MKKVTAIALVLFLTIAELVGFMSVYVLMNPQRDILNGIIEFTFGKSVFDLFIMMVLRCCVLMGTCFAVLFNEKDAVRRIKMTNKPVTFFSCFMIIYAVVKIMYGAEDESMGVCEWILAGQIFLSCGTMYLYWKVLSKIQEPVTVFKKTLSINCDEDRPEDLSSEAQLISSGSSFPEKNKGKENLNDLDRKRASQFTTSNITWKLIKMAKHDVLYVFLAFLSLVTCSIGQVFLPYYTGQVVDYIIIDKSVEKFKKAMLYLALITILQGFAGGTRGGLFTLIKGRYVTRLQNQLFSHIMKMEIGFFDQRKTGEITSRLTSDCTKVGDRVGLNVNVFLRNVVKVIGVLFFMIKISWKLSVITLVSIPVISIISEAFGEKYRKVAEKVQNSLAKANENAVEAIANIRTVRNFAAEEQEIQRYSERLNVAYKLYKQQGILVCVYRWSTEVTDLAMKLLILYYGGHLVIQNDLSGGSLLSFVLYSIELGFAFDEIGNMFTGLMEAVGASKNLFIYIERKPRISLNGNISDRKISGNVKFENVSFSYPSREDKEVLNEVSFEVNKGEVLALVGPSGGGKSSIVNLLEHFYEPSHGNILIDQIPLKMYEHHFLHEQMSLVQQEPVLFARSIAENIGYGLQHDVTKEDIIKAATMSNAHSFIENMPEQYDTETGEKGIQLSAGQKQRVAIARALIRNPSILILDEATSALDSESEYLVQQAINKNLLGRTVIMIAHRLSTIEKADKILVIDRGKIIQQGTHKELLSCEGLYAELVKKQMLGVNGV